MSNDQHEDKRVSAAYKDLARERTPEHLDQKVLAMAAGATRKPVYSRWLAWSRPAAWAATITLCLAITLELAQGPAMDVSVEANRPASVPAADEYKRDNDDAVEQDLASRQGTASEPLRLDDQDLAKDKALAKEEVAASIKPGDMELQRELAESIANSAASEKTSLARSAAKQSHNEPAPILAEPEAEARDTAVAFEAEPSMETPAAMEMSLAPSRARAEEAALMSNAAMSDDFSAEESVCSAEVRAIADDWLDCILELEADGRGDAAATERELLIDTFPDFKLP